MRGMTYAFAAESQYIFHTEIDGIQYLVQFGFRNGNGSSVFQTQNAKVAEAIRRTSMFKRGAIVETTVWPKKDDALKGAAQNGSTKDTKDTKGGARDDSEAPAGNADEEPKMEVKVFANITQAKEFVSKEYGVAKRLLKKPEQVIEEAKKHGVKIEIERVEG